MIEHTDYYKPACSRRHGNICCKVTFGMRARVRAFLLDLSNGTHHNRRREYQYPAFDASAYSLRHGYFEPYTEAGKNNAGRW